MRRCDVCFVVSPNHLSNEQLSPRRCRTQLCCPYKWKITDTGATGTLIPVKMEWFRMIKQTWQSAKNIKTATKLSFEVYMKCWILHLRRMINCCFFGQENHFVTCKLFYIHSLSKNVNERKFTIGHIEQDAWWCIYVYIHVIHKKCETHSHVLKSDYQIF